MTEDIFDGSGKIYVCEYCGHMVGHKQTIKLHMQKHFPEIEEARNIPGHMNWREYKLGEEII